MKRKFMTRTVSLGLGVALLCGASTMLLTACSGISNEDTALLLSSNPLDRVFNPFFYTSGDDGEVVGYTQVGMLSSDDDGKPVAGKDEMCVALDYSVVTTGTSADKANDDDYSNFYTDYYFAIKNGLKFSDGHDLTIKDVLFNLYMYLDPCYTGSSTMYSVDIQGLAAYRTQKLDKKEQDQFDEYFQTEALTRISAIRAWANKDESVWSDASLSEFGPHVKEDILKAHDYFKEELKTDWNNAQNATMKEYEKYPFTEGWEVFLFGYGNAGGITTTPKKDAEGKIIGYDVDYNGTKEMAHDEETLTNHVYNGMVGGYTSASKAYKTNIYNLVTYYATATKLREYLVAQAISEYFEGKGLSITSVSGITTEKMTKIPYKDEAGNVKERELGEACDVLKIRINGVDPKAIQNFSFTVAPMHYYSSVADVYSNPQDKIVFGLRYANPDFMDEVKVNHVPLGAGPYRATTSKGTSATDKIDEGDFFKDNLVYFERNENFMLGAPKIKKLRLKVTNNSTLYQSILKGEVHYGMPTATREMMEDVRGKDSKVLGYALTDNLGYGYIGVNASFVKDINVRRAIMHAMDIGLVMEYYGSSELVDLIYRPMSKTLVDYYPEDAQARYPFDSSGETSAALVRQAGYRLENGVLTKGNDKLKFTFTVAGETTDHPGYRTLYRAGEILNKIGFDITVTNDSQALTKLGSGLLSVWAAAWSSSSDPDMYQVYHKKSNATSILNWGFPYLIADGTSQEKRMINDLKDLIEEGREYTEPENRRPIYNDAMNLVMDLAVELPTYQRKNLYVYQKGVLDESTFYPNPQGKAYRSPLSHIWEVSFIESK